MLLGDPPLFPRHEEVELSWQILDPIEEFWADAGPARAVPLRHLGAGVGRRDDGPRRPGLEATVIIDLPDTDTGAVAGKLVELRETGGRGRARAASSR